MLQKELTEYAARLETVKSHFRLKNTDLARIAGVSDNSISKIMNGITESPDVKTLVRIARKFNISGNWLFLGEGPMFKDDVTEDNNLKKGLQLRDELIAQLQKELWGKLEGATDRPLSKDEIKFLQNMFNYKLSVIGSVMDVEYLLRTAQVNSKVGGTQLAYAASAV